MNELRLPAGPVGLKGRLIDLALVAVALFHGYIAAYEYTPLTLTVTGVGVLGIFVRREHPWVCLLIALPGLFLADAVVAPLVGLYSLAAAGLSIRYLAPLSLVLMIGFSAFWRGFPTFKFAVLISSYAIFSTLAALAGGMLMRTRADLSESLDDLKSARAREIQRVEIDARNAERTRLAREMHDVVSHQVSLVAVQAGALQVESKDPQVVETSTTIRRLAVKAIEELRHMVSVLRDEAGLNGNLGPSKGLSDLPQLYEESGMNIESTLEIPDDLPPQLERAIYRTIQEGLTNARKYAPGSLVSVECDANDQRLRLTVTNGPAVGEPTAEDSSGQGLIGLAERADSLAGSLTATPTDEGGFRIAFEAPLSQAKFPVAAEWK